MAGLTPALAAKQVSAMTAWRSCSSRQNGDRAVAIEEQQSGWRFSLSYARA
jgi:hypothetical protein